MAEEEISENLENNCGNCGHPKADHMRLNANEPAEYGVCGAEGCDCKQFV